ncbi:hypothetical protein CTAYLR_008038 [Chrysophaeum taylorii]|uniref:Protein kinase domain-containing protein n=1 Tax=Chrysophaeum taylorii TaxID=2483200 RepID=A0AAD7U704_9STRA|nr:hypothetical protein CTAYLR_008038 [Chrysophaeum taylorii]
MRLADFEIKATIGTGGFGERVKVAYDRMEGEWRALKVFDKSVLVANDVLASSYVAAELAMLRRIKHPFVVELVGQFHDAAHVYLVLELLPGGDLRRLLARGPLAAIDARFYATQLASALEHLRDESVVCRNVRPETVCIDTHGYAKLVDFGFAKKVVKRTLRTMCGVPEYVAPEIIENRGYGIEVDAWALGVLIFEMLVGYPPFCGTSPLDVYKRVLKTDPRPSARCAGEARDLVASLLVRDPAKRLVHLRSHPWFATVHWVALLAREAPGVPFAPPRASSWPYHFDALDEEDAETEEPPVSAKLDSLIAALEDEEC